MKIKKSILIVFLVFTVSLTYGQCKYAKKRAVKFVNKQLTTQIQTMTKPKIIFNKFSNTSSGAFFINENDEYFLALSLVRTNYSAKFEILEKQKLVINFENNIDLTLISFDNVESKTPGITLSAQLIWAVYEVDKEQIKIFAENPLFNLKIYFVSLKNISNTFEDEDGKYFEFEVKADKYKSNLIEPANCILQIN